MQTFRPFWVTWADSGDVALGSGNDVGKNEILSYSFTYDVKSVPITVEHVQVSTYLAGTGGWEIGQTIGKI